MSDGWPTTGNTLAITQAVTVHLLHNVICDYTSVLIPVINLSSVIMRIVARSTIV
jgi:hypothetical protein